MSSFKLGHEFASILYLWTTRKFPCVVHVHTVYIYSKKIKNLCKHLRKVKTVGIVYMESQNYWNCLHGKSKLSALFTWKVKTSNILLYIYFISQFWSENIHIMKLFAYKMRKVMTSHAIMCFLAYNTAETCVYCKNFIHKTFPCHSVNLIERLNHRWRVCATKGFVRKKMWNWVISGSFCMESCPWIPWISWQIHDKYRGPFGYWSS